MNVVCGLVVVCEIFYGGLGEFLLNIFIFLDVFVFYK